MRLPETSAPRLVRLPGPRRRRRPQPGRRPREDGEDRPRRRGLPAPRGGGGRRAPGGGAPHARADRRGGGGCRPAGPAARPHGSDPSPPEEDDESLRHARPAAPGRLARQPGERGGSRVTVGERLKILRLERALQQRQLAEKANLTPSMVSQIESGRLTPSLHTLGKLAAGLGGPIASLFETRPDGRIHVSRRGDYPVVSFDGTTEKWHVLGAGLFQGKIRAVVSTIGRKGRGGKTEKVIIEPGQMKVFYLIEGTVAPHSNGDRPTL